MAAQQNTISRFHNLSDAALADELGRVDAISKAAEAELEGAQGRVQGARGRWCESTWALPIRVSRSPMSTVIRIKAANRALPIAA